MYSFSQLTLDILYHHGWTPEREIDITPYKNYFIETQQSYSEIILNFLRHFGALELICPSSIRTDLTVPLCINPFDGPSYEWFEVYSTREWIGKPLCNLGTLESSGLAMSPDGCIYSCFDAYVFKEGDSGEEAIENICTGVPSQRIFKRSE